MQYIICDPADVRLNLLPLTYTRPVGALRMGIDTMADRWKALLPGQYYWLTEPHLQELYPAAPSVDCDTVYIQGNIFATAELANAISALKEGQSLVKGDTLIARRGEGDDKVEFDGDILAINQVYDLFMHNAEAVCADFGRVTDGAVSQPLSPTNIVIGDPSLIFIEEGARIEAATLNTTQGPIYVGRDAEIMEGCHLRGPVAMCQHSVANMGTLIYGATTLGPWCKVGGELNNVVMIGYSNKAHDGFLGNAVIGEWCNLGAGTIASNLKNDYSEIKLWNYAAHRFVRTGLQFCGLIMGDHSKAAINTSFNTATVVGVGCNIVSEGMPRVFIPSFLKGGTAGFDEVNLNEFFTIAARVMARRGVILSDAHRRLYTAIAEYSERYK
ncbi:MAG: putative sugar nucleotidyl transferase [Bacteroidales bacterium]|nr:putative sugar nucleotidyl transferase [Bacteroidales bacterium]